MLITQSLDNFLCRFRFYNKNYTNSNGLQFQYPHDHDKNASPSAPTSKSEELRQTPPTIKSPQQAQRKKQKGGNGCAGAPNYNNDVVEDFCVGTARCYEFCVVSVEVFEEPE